MKKLILFFVFLALLVNYANAGDMHYIDFSGKKVAILTMAEGDAVKFMFPVREYYTPIVQGGKESIEFREEEEEQVFMLREVKENKNKIKLADVTTFISVAPTPQYTTLNTKTKLQLDFDLDMVDDLEIRVLDFSDGDNATFEFIVMDKSNADYRPIKYADKSKKSGLGSITGSSATVDSIKSYFNRIRGVISNNAELSMIVIVVLLIFIFNRRPVERALRRIF